MKKYPMVKNYHLLKKKHKGDSPENNDRINQRDPEDIDLLNH